VFALRSVRIAALLVFAFWLVPQCLLAQIQVQDVTFTDEFHGWVLLTQPTSSLFRTSDGGRSWVRFPLTVNKGFYLIRFLDANTGLGIQPTSTDEVTVYRTTDGGQNWRNVTSIKERYLSVTDLRFIGPDEALMTGESEGRGWVAELYGKGRTLHVRHDLPLDLETQSTQGILDGGDGHLWIVGKQFILHSADNGGSWENQAPNAAPPIDLGLAGVALPGGRAWFAAGNFDIYRTEDYGKHWIRAHSTTNEGGTTFHGISFLSVSDGCAVGNSSFIYCTSDGGVTWHRTRVFKKFPRDSQLRPWSKLFLFNSGSGWASVNGSLYKTVDRGKSFNNAVGLLK